MRLIMIALLLSSALVVGSSRHLDAKTSDPQAMAFLKPDIGGVVEKGWTVITVELPPDTANSWHSQPQGEFLYVLEGAGRLEVDGKRALTLNPGSVATLTSIPRHVLKNSSRTKILKILVVFLNDKNDPHPLLDARLTPGLQAGGNAGSTEGRQPRLEQKSPDIGLVF
jgi:quercetin dioxygenase-like cupin family protein